MATHYQKVALYFGLEYGVNIFMNVYVFTFMIKLELAVPSPQIRPTSKPRAGWFRLAAKP
jgi:hypothetical protein